jgi:Domain of Unknown Function (DUF1080)
VAASKHSIREKIVMKHWSVVRIALALFGLAAFSHLHQAFGQTDAGWVTLFDGKNLDNWNKIGDANWRLEDGAVVADKGDGFLVSKNAYTDFRLRAPSSGSMPTPTAVFSFAAPIPTKSAALPMR